MFKKNINFDELKSELKDINDKISSLEKIIYALCENINSMKKCALHNINHEEIIGIFCSTHNQHISINKEKHANKN